MDDSDHNTQPVNLPAVVDPPPMIPVPGAQQRPTRWHSSTLPDRLRRASRHPAVVGSLVTAAGLLLNASLRRTLPSPRQLAQLAGSAITPTPSASIANGSWVLFTRTVVVETWTVRGPQL